MGVQILIAQEQLFQIVSLILPLTIKRIVTAKLDMSEVVATRVVEEGLGMWVEA